MKRMRMREGEGEGEAGIERGKSGERKGRKSRNREREREGQGGGGLLHPSPDFLVLFSAAQGWGRRVSEAIPARADSATAIHRHR